MALARTELDTMGCATPNCGHDHTVLYLHSACHPQAGATVSYDKRTGFLTVECTECGKLVTDVKVADQ